MDNMHKTLSTAQFAHTVIIVKILKCNGESEALEFTDSPLSLSDCLNTD